MVCSGEVGMVAAANDCDQRDRQSETEGETEGEKKREKNKEKERESESCCITKPEYSSLPQF